MKFFKSIFIILIVFFKTETLLSENNLFNVNNIQIEKKEKSSNDTLANQAIKIGFNQFISKILLPKDIKKLTDLNFTTIRQLVTYYQVSNVLEEKNRELVSFSVTFDKEKIHDLFFQKGIRYSEIIDKELYVLPIHKKDEKIFIFNNNFFYENWSKIFEADLLEFILPLENIEIIQNINNNKENLINLEIDRIFQEYTTKNLAIVIIEENNNNEFVYIKSKIQNKTISKKLDLKKKRSSGLYLLQKNYYRNKKRNY